MALLAILAVFALGATWFLVSQLNAESATLDAVRKQRNAEVLNRAKQALIGYIAAQAAKTGENNPGALPCPEAPGNFDSTTGDDGKVSGSCSPPLVGRFPWKTLGLDKLVDSSGEPLWYAVAAGWAGGGTVINSNCASYDASSTQACRAGRLTVDGVTDDVIALIIAPGQAFNVATATGCSARSQTRPSTGTPNLLDYLECDNATSPNDTFVTTGPSGSFNDQMVAIRASELIPAVEAAIAHRVETEIVPALKSVYASSSWHSSLSATNPLLPHPAAFGNPATSNYRGSAAQSAGLFPVFQTQGCTPATDTRCTTATTGGSAFLVFSKSGNDTYTALIDILNPLNLGWIRTQSTCNWSGENYICTGEYQAFPIAVTLRLRVTNVAMGLRTFNPAQISCTAVDDVGAGLGSQSIGCASTSVALQSDGSAIVTVTTNWTPSIILSAWGTYANYVITFNRAVFGDHGLVDPSDSGLGWFVRNKWHEVAYYAAASGHRAAALPTLSCTTGSTCLSVANVTPAGAQRALLILAGRSINGSTRPSSTLANYLEFGNATAAYESQPVSQVVNSSLKAPFNDRVVVVSSN